MRKISVKPIEELEIQVSAKKKYILSFNMLSMAYIQEEIQRLKCKLSEIPSDKMLLILVYGGIKANDDSFTMGDAQSIVKMMGVGHYTMVMNMYNDAMQDTLDDESKEKLKKLTVQYLSNVAK